MSDIIIGGNTYNGVNTIKVKNTNNDDVSFNENPFLVDTTQPPLEKYLGKLCKDTTTEQEYIVARGNDGSFVKKDFPFTGAFLDCIYADGKWFMVVRDSSYVYVYYSTDTTNWTLSLKEASTTGKLCYGNGILVLYNLSTSVIKYTIDFVNWSSYTLPNSSSNQKALMCAFGNGRFLIHTSYGSGTTYYANYYTTDFTTFTNVTGDITHGLFFVNGYFHRLYGSGTNCLFKKSLDGITWTTELGTLSVGGTLSVNGCGMIYVDGYYYVFRMGNNGLYKCQDGSTSWTTNGAPNPIFSLLYLNNTFYLGTSAGKIYKSPTASSWVECSFVSEAFTVPSLATDGSKIMGRYANGIANPLSQFILSDSSDNLYYRPIYY